MVRSPSARELIGKRIVGLKLNSYYAVVGNYRQLIHDPEIFLDDGSILRFVTEENPDGGEYGTKLIRARRPKPRRKTNDKTHP